MNVKQLWNSNSSNHYTAARRSHCKGLERAAKKPVRVDESSERLVCADETIVSNSECADEAGPAWRLDPRVLWSEEA